MTEMTPEEKADILARLAILDQRAYDLTWRDRVPTWMLVTFVVVMYGGMSVFCWMTLGPWFALVPVGFLAYCFALVHFLWKD